MLRPHARPVGLECLAISSSLLPKGKRAMRGPMFAWGQGMGPVGFGRCLWNFLQRGPWQESQQGGETVSALWLTLHLPGLHRPSWVSPGAVGSRGLLPKVPPRCSRILVLFAALVPCVCGSIVCPCCGAAMGGCGTRCLIRSTLSSRDPCPPRQGPACHYGLYKAAAQ